MQFDELFPQRRQKQQNKLAKYFKYIFNDHFVIALMFFIGALGFQYSQWVKTLSQATVIMNIVFVMILTVTTLIGRLATYIKPADAQFLLPLESKWLHYFEKSLLSSMLLPTILIVVVILMAYPFLLATQQVVWWQLVILIIQTVVLKYINLQGQFESLHMQTDNKRQTIKLASVGLTFIALFLSIQFSLWIGLIISLLALISVIFMQSKTKKQQNDFWEWPYIVTLEERRQQTQNRLISLFIDVPQLSVKAQRRKYLDWLQVKAGSPYAYLFSRAFWRGNELSSLWIRLSLIGMILLIVLPDHWLTVIVAVFIQYISHFQVLPLFKQFDRHLLLQTYPISKDDKLNGFQKFIQRLLISQWLVFSLILLIFNSLFTALVYILFGLLFVYVFNLFYIPRILSKKHK